MHKIKMIAPKYLIAPLAILGIEIFPADSEDEARLALAKAMSKNEPCLIFLSERLAVNIQDEVEKITTKADVNIVLIPDNKGSTGLAAGQIQSLVRNSIGAEVIINQ